MRDPVGVSERRRRGRLDAAELAETAVLGDLALVLALGAWFLPVLGGLLFLAASVPYAVLSSRRRLRAVVVALVTTGLLAFVVGGISFVLNLAGIAGVGAAVGIAHRRGYRRLGTVASSIVVCWLPAAVATVALLAVFEETRKLTLKQAEVTTRSTVKFLEHAHLDGFAQF